MVKCVFIFGLILLFFSCKKAEDRSCYKSYGELIEKEIPLDSVSEFRLYKNITYHVYQDTMRKLIVRTGDHLVNFILAENVDGILSISNKNKCHFLRDYDKKTVVEIHYPFYNIIYSEANDSLIFKNTIAGNYLEVEQNLGGAAVVLDVDVNHIMMIASGGVSRFDLSGVTNYADLRVQTNGSGDAGNLKANYIYVYNNSTGDLLVDLDTADADIHIKGTGNVIYYGAPDTLSLEKTGDGSLIKL